jgi:hypothetical protein
MKHKLNFVFYGPTSSGVEVISEYICNHHNLLYVTRKSIVQFALTFWDEDEKDLKMLKQKIKKQEYHNIDKELMAKLFSIFYRENQSKSTNAGFLFHNFPATLEECKMMGLLSFKFNFP